MDAYSSPPGAIGILEAALRSQLTPKVVESIKILYLFFFTLSLPFIYNQL
jgi:hypothetical protein